MTNRFDEIGFERQDRESQKKRFLRRLQQWENNEVARLKSEGWKYVKTMRRTVVLLIGEVTLQRKVLYKDGEWKKPIDEYLGLVPHAQYSLEMTLCVLETVVDLSMRKSGYHLERLKGLNISKDMVLKARKEASRLYQERLEYEDFQDNVKKRKVKRLYIEGDGVWLKEQFGGKKKPEGNRGFEIAHFVVHEGSKTVNGDTVLINKHNVVNRSNLMSRAELQDYLYKTYEITPEMELITNSDMGAGYAARVFKELAQFLGCKWEHFYDGWHLKKNIQKHFRMMPQENETDEQVECTLEQRLFDSIEVHDKKEARLILDTATSRINDDDKRKKFDDFARGLLRNFKFTKSVKLRGLSHVTLGVMESQQSMITDRTKHRRMSWTREGGETLVKLIIDVKEKRLRELFLGEWRTEWEAIQKMPPVSKYLEKTQDTPSVSQGHLVKNVLKARKTIKNI